MFMIMEPMEGNYPSMYLLPGHKKIPDEKWEQSLLTFIQYLHEKYFVKRKPASTIAVFELTERNKTETTDKNRRDRNHVAMIINNNLNSLFDKYDKAHPRITLNLYEKEKELRKSVHIFFGMSPVITPTQTKKITARLKKWDDRFKDKKLTTGLFGNMTSLLQTMPSVNDKYTWDCNHIKPQRYTLNKGIEDIVYEWKRIVKRY